MTERVLYLIRHGQSDFDSEEMLSTPRGEQFDPPLSAQGREQAELLARRLLVMDGPGVVVTSAMRRTRETIAPFAAATRVEVLEEPELIEAHIGEWERVSFRDLLLEDADLLHRVRRQEPVWRHAPGVEELEPFRGRVRAAIEGASSGTRRQRGRRVPRGRDQRLPRADHGRGPRDVLPAREHESQLDRRRRGAASVRFLNDVLHLTDPQLFDDGRRRLSGAAGARAPSHTRPAPSARRRRSRSHAVPVPFLSDEWTDELQRRLNESDAFRSAIAGKTATIQNVIADPRRSEALLVRDHRRLGHARGR